MRVIKEGTGAKEWSKIFTCTGKGNKDGGCQAELEVAYSDLFKTWSYCRDERDMYITFACPECAVLTDIDRANYPPNYSNLPDQKDHAEGKKKRNIVKERCDALLSALLEYQADNHIRNDRDSELFNKAEKAISNYYKVML
jgi:hypothetical protein